MNIKRASMFAAAAFLSAGVAAIAQAPAISVVGCVQKESSVLKRAPIAGNVGMDDEFVLTFAKLAPAAGATEEKPDAQADPSAAALPGTFGTVYRLTGDKEKDLKSLVGQRVEISGTMKDKEKTTDAMSSIGTSGKTGELTPSNTAEITIDSVKPTSGSCAPAIK